MTKPIIESFIYIRKEMNRQYEFKIKKKDFGIQVLYDVLFKNFFLFTISGKGELLVVNWDAVGDNKIKVDETTVSGIFSFVKGIE